MTTATTDTDAILAEPTNVTFVSGREVKIQRLKTVQMLRLLRIFTKGIGDDIANLNFDVESEDFGSNLVSLALLAIPEAEMETIEFVQSMVEPVGLIENPKTKADREKNTEILTEFYLEVQNPELDDLLTVIEKAIENEGPHLAALGKRVAALLQTQAKSIKAKSGSKKK